MSEAPRVSIVIVSWNVRTVLRTCLQSIHTHVMTPHEIIVIDNASTDGTVAMIRSEFPEVQCIANTMNVGFARANNQARNLCRGAYICLLNPDTELVSDIFQTLVPWIETRPRVGAVGCELLHTDHTHQQSVRAFPRLADQLIILMKLNWLARLLPWMRRYYADPGAGQRQPLRVDQVMGAMMLVPSQLMTEVGWFDEGYPNWFEEVDLCQRVYRHGCEVWYVPTVSMLHHGGSSFGQVLSIKKHRWFIAGIRRYAKKFWPRWQSMIIDIVAPISYGLTVLQSLVKPR